MMFEINNIIFICSILREKHVHCRMCVLTWIIVNFIFIYLVKIDHQSRDRDVISVSYELIFNSKTRADGDVGSATTI